MPNPNHLDDEMREICNFQAMTLANTGRITDFDAIKNTLVAANIFRNSPLPVVTPVMTDIPDRLTKKELEDFLIEFKRWNLVEHEKPGNLNDDIIELYRLYEFKSYEDAFDFMKKVDEYAIQPFKHHPRIQITYNRIEIWLCTFNIGHKPSQRDIRLAKICEEIYNDSVFF
jgi:pterin-4a-carbinolamine dehydratase